MNITLVGHLNTFTSYGIHLLETAKWLNRFGHQVSIRSIKTETPWGTSIPQWAKDMVVKKVQPGEWEIMIASGGMAPTPGKKTILFTMHESTVMEPQRVSAINSAVHVVVPSRWCEEVFKANGVTVPISVIPLGYDPEIFRWQKSPWKSEFVFGCAGSTQHSSNRKGLDHIITCFQQAMESNNRVKLLVKTRPDCHVKLVRDSRIEINSEHFSGDQLRAWISRIDCFVSYGTEAFGLWPLQVMACEKPVIGIDYGGLSDLKLPFFAPHLIKKAKDPYQGEWAVMDRDRLMSYMRSMDCQREHVAASMLNVDVSHLTWENSARQLEGLYLDLVSKDSSASRISKRTCIVQLGRFGDIINILPVAKAIHDRDGVKPVMMVAKHFASILDGVSYVEPHEFNGVFDELDKAVAIARESYSDVLVTQLHGQHVKATQDSFAKESWTLAGFLSHWGKLHLVFDKRDEERERKLVDSLKNDKPMLLVNLIGTSSPFPFSEELMEDILFRWDHKLNIVDLSQVRAERVYDLLGLYDEAEFLVTTDTATLHLINGSRTPISHVALIASTPTLWHGSPYGAGIVMALRYSEAMVRREEIHSAIENTVCENPFGNDLVHVTSDYKLTGDGIRRCEVARKTWKKSYCQSPSWKPLPVLNEQLPRIFKDGKRELAYVRDILNFACMYADASDDIVMTNSDICFSTELTQAVLHLGNSKTGYAYRRDFYRIEEPIPDKKIKDGADYPGTDVFIMRCSWWREHGSKFPDMLIGTEAWDPVMRHFMQEFDKPVVLKDLVYHERHASEWERAENRYTLPSQIHNLRLANTYFRSKNIDPTKFGIKEV